jgi:hypothetical protein
MTWIMSYCDSIFVDLWIGKHTESILLHPSEIPNMLDCCLVGDLGFDLPDFIEFVICNRKFLQHAIPDSPR